MSERSFRVAIVGATGIVGQELRQVLEQRLFPLAELNLYASTRSAGDTLTCGPLSSRVDLLPGARFADTDIAFFTGGEQVSAEWSARAAEAGAVVIDTSSLFVSDPQVPLVVPEVNAFQIGDYLNRNLIVSPDPVAAALAVALKPLRDAVGLTRVAATTLEPASGAGKAGVEELQSQVVDLLNGRDAEVAAFPQRLAFNAIPAIGDFLAGGWTRPEEVTSLALRRLLDEDMTVHLTRIRVPTFFGVGISVHLNLAQPLSPREAREVLREAPGVFLQDEEDEPKLVTPADSIGEDATLVSRIRGGDELDRLDLWIAVDNTRKGSSVNAVQIAEILARDYL